MDLGIDNERSLDQFFRFLRAHHLRSALEIGLLLDSQLVSPRITHACATEAFGNERSVRAVFQKIKDPAPTTALKHKMDATGTADHADSFDR